MNAILLPTPQESRIQWRRTTVRRSVATDVESDSGKFSHRLLEGVYTQQIQTVTTPPDTIRLERELVDILRDCSDSDWDGYGASPIDRASVTSVYKFLSLLPSDVTYPELSPEPTGNLTMVWRKRGYHLIIGINPEGQIAWGGTSPHGHLYGDAEFDSVIPEELIDILHCVEGNK